MSYCQVYGDILTITEVDAIVHQVNCLTVKSHGLSSQIAHKYPWADLYTTRDQVGTRNLATPATRGRPGTLRIFRHAHYPAVVCLQAQWDFGRCDDPRHRHIPPYTDTKEHRVEWFEQCLHELGHTEFKTIAFPFKIGCGLAGGAWVTYRHRLKEFAQKYHKHVIIVVPRK